MQRLSIGRKKWKIKNERKNFITPTNLQQEMVIRKLTQPNVVNLINGYINLI